MTSGDDDGRYPGGAVDTVVPDGEARLLPDAAHGFSMTHVDECLAAIRRAQAF